MLIRCLLSSLKLYLVGRLSTQWWFYRSRLVVVGRKAGIFRLDIIVSFDCADGCKSPAGAAISLVCNGDHIRSPIDFRRLLMNWFRNRNFVVVVFELSCRNWMYLVFVFVRISVSWRRLVWNRLLQVLFCWILLGWYQWNQWNLGCSLSFSHFGCWWISSCFWKSCICSALLRYSSRISFWIRSGWLWIFLFRLILEVRKDCEFNVAFFMSDKYALDYAYGDDR